MQLQFNTDLAKNYHNASQVARILTEDWMGEQMYCPRCGYERLEHFPNNRAVADFFCPKCNHQYELKSKQGSISDKIPDGAYDTMIARILSRQNPDFFFMHYDINRLCVRELLLIPKHFFVPGIIEKRKALSPTARRAGWIGCNIILKEIPRQGRIQIVKDGKAIARDIVMRQLAQSNLLAQDNLESRGWLLDALLCMEQLPNVFSLSEMYRFVEFLSKRHPNNNHIKAKIRQQMQKLRDKGYVNFLGKGLYQKTAEETI